MSEHSYSPVPQPPADRSVKVPHLVFGLLFVGIAGIWALGVSDAISGEHLAVLGPAVLILAGIAGLAASLASGRNRRRAQASEPHYETRYEGTYDTDVEDDPTDTQVLQTEQASQPTQPTQGDEPTEEIR